MPHHADPAERLRPHLIPGEKLIWCDRPRQGLVFSRQDLFNIPFGALLVGFSALMVINSAGNFGFLPTLMSGFFLVFGLNWMIGAHLVDAHRRSYTIYGISDRRALILTGRRFPALTSHLLRRLSQGVIDPSPFSRSSIYLGEIGTNAWHRNYRLWPLNSENAPSDYVIGDPEFAHLTDPELVREALAVAISSATASQRLVRPAGPEPPGVHSANANVIIGRLEPGETLLWVGWPGKALIFNPQDDFIALLIALMFATWAELSLREAQPSFAIIRAIADHSGSYPAAAK